MIKDIIDAIKANSVITSQISDISAFSSGNFESIVYKFIPVNCDKITVRDRLEITIISSSIDKIDIVTNALKECLLTMADRQFNNKILQVELNGGGCIENLETNTYHQFLYFDIKSKY